MIERLVLELGEEKFDLSLSSLAVEKIEEEYDATLDEVLKNTTKMRAKQVNFMLWAISNTEMTLEDFKVLLAKHYSYNQSIDLLTRAFGGDPNEVLPIAEATESK